MSNSRATSSGGKQSRCPQCKGSLPKDRTKDFPFCCERCRLLDLGAWASERYVIRGKPLEDAQSIPDGRSETDHEAQEDEPEEEFERGSPLVH